MSDEDDIFGGPALDMSWADLGRINAEGYVDTEPVCEDPRIFDDQFEMRSREIQRQPNGIQPVNPYEAKTGPWSRSPNLGISRLFAPSANNEQTILKLDEWGFPRVWSVMLGLTFREQSPAIAGNGFSVVAKVIAGAGGSTQEFEIDWRQGMTFHTVMNALNVIALYDETSDIPSDLELTVTLGHHRLTGSLPTRSYRITSASPRLRIPPFATSLKLSNVFTPDATFANIFDATSRIIFFTVAPAAPSIQSFSGSELLALGSLPIPNGACFIDISTSLARTLVCNAMFELCL